MDFSYIVVQLIKKKLLVLLLNLFFSFLSNELLDEAEQRAFVLIKCIICPQTTEFSPRIRKLNVQKCTQLQNNPASLYFSYFHHLPTNNQIPKSVPESNVQKCSQLLKYQFHQIKTYIVQFVIYFLASVPEYFLVFNHSTFCHFHGI